MNFTNDMSPLQNSHALARLCEVGGRDEAVVPAADDEGVIALLRRGRLGTGQQSLGCE